MLTRKTNTARRVSAARGRQAVRRARASAGARSALGIVSAAALLAPAALLSAAGPGAASAAGAAGTSSVDGRRPATRAAARPNATGVRIASFDLRLEGRESTTWESHHMAEGGCDLPMDGSGDETFTLHSRPLRVRAIADGKDVRLVSAHGTATIALRGTVRRAGSITVGTSEEVCSSGDGTGGTTPPAPDCGTRKVSSTVEVDFMASRPDWLVLSEGTGADPFKQCPTGSSDQFPHLLAYDDRDRRIGQSLRVDDLFKYGKSIVVARGFDRVQVPETSSTTEIRWTLSLTRVRGAGR